MQPIPQYMQPTQYIHITFVQKTKLKLKLESYRIKNIEFAHHVCTYILRRFRSYVSEMLTCNHHGRYYHNSPADQIQQNNYRQIRTCMARLPAQLAIGRFENKWITWSSYIERVCLSARLSVEIVMHQDLSIPTLPAWDVCKCDEGKNNIWYLS